MDNALKHVSVYEPHAVLVPGILHQAVPAACDKLAHTLDEPCSLKVIEAHADVPVTDKVFAQGCASRLPCLCIAGHKPLVDDEAYAGKEHGHG